MLKRNQFIVDGLIVFIILLFIHFFSFTLFSPQSKITSSVVYGIGVLMLLVSFIGILFKRNRIKNSLDNKVLLFIISMLISSFMANWYWNQSFGMSLKGYIYFYIYGLYFLLAFLEISSARIERILKLFFFTSLMVFLIDFVTFPDPLFSWRSEERRAGITLLFFGQGFTLLGAFYYLNKFFIEKKIVYLVWYLSASFCLFYLTQSRMNLLGLVLGFFIMLISSDFHRKYLISLCLITVAVFLYSSSNLFSGIKEASADQAEYYKEDIRVLAHNYFIYDLQGGLPTILFGNGVPLAESNLGLATEKANAMGFWTADVGLTGIFSYFGIFGVIIWISFFYSVFKMKSVNNLIYIKLYFVALLTTAFVAYAIFEPGYMPATIFALYLVRCHNIVEVET